MDPGVYPRKLAAILSADVAGYSALMRQDEASTVKTLEAYKEILSKFVSRNRGRVVDAPGDYLLAEFASVVDAVSCAVSAQAELRRKYTDIPESQRMRFRMGVNLGDVIEEGPRIYGDGVNLADRIQSLADPGGVCISKTAYDQVETKLPFKWEYLGDRKVKGSDKPVSAYKVHSGDGFRPSRQRTASLAAKRFLPALLLLCGIIAGITLSSIYWQPSQIEPASQEKMSFPLPEIPSIAVLPFANKSDDPKMELFCDGVTDNVITALSKDPQIMVIARSSTAAYKGTSAKIRQVSESFGVQFILEGGVQKSGDRIRITAQLFDALKGTILWGDTYDRNLTDIFDLQDEIVRRVFSALRTNISMEPALSLKHFKGQQGLECYLKLLQASELTSRWNVEDNNTAKRLIEEALAICPDTPMGYYQLGWYYHHASSLDHTMTPEEAINRSIELAHKAASIDSSLSQPFTLLCSCYLSIGELDKAMAECERAVTLNPGSMDSLSEYAWSLTFAGRYQEGIQIFQQILRRNPFAKSSVFRGIGMALMFNGQIGESLSAIKAGLQRSPNDIHVHLLLAILYSMLGRDKDAKLEAAEALRLNPKYGISRYVKRWAAIRDPAARESLVNALKKAGLPEKSTE